MLNVLGLNTRAPYHLFLYSIIFGGSSVYSFIISPVAFKTLPREDFGKLQNKIFPWYFLGQTLSPILLSLTTPLKLCPFTKGLLAIASITGAINYFYLLPKCQGLKDERTKLVKDNLHEKDGKETEEYIKLSKQFGKFHGISLLVNTLSISVVGVYGMVLSRRLL